MTQHVLLTMVAPPLLLLGRPWPRMLKPFASSVRRPVARAMLVGSTLEPCGRSAAGSPRPCRRSSRSRSCCSAWHLPALYDLTLRYGFVHDAEHLLFFTTALLLWAHLIPGAAGRPQLSDGQRAAYGTAGLLVSWVLAVVLGLRARRLSTPRTRRLRVVPAGSPRSRTSRSPRESCGSPPRCRS